MPVPDLVVADLLIHQQTLDAALVGALQDAVTYRGLFLLVLERLYAEHRYRLAADERLQQAMGVTPWHPEEDAAL